MDSVFLQYLRHNLLREIKEVELESPTVSYLSKCTKQVKTHESYLTTFKILFSKTKGKIKNLLKSEEKLKVSSGKFSTKGTILSVEEDEVTLEMNRKLEVGEYTLDRITNFNNNIILKHLENFKKEVPKEILDGWINNLRLRVVKDSDQSVDLYEFLKSKTTNLDADDVTSIIDNHARYDKEIPLTYESNSQSDLSFFDDNLNESQKSAISHISKSRSYKIVGPPGTGKTRTVVEILSQLLQLNNRVLVAGPSNITIDNIIERFLLSKYFLNHEPLFYRLGSSIKGLTKYNLETQIKHMTGFVERDKNERNFIKNLKNLKQKYKVDLQEESKVVFSTLFSSHNTHSSFDWVIIDEACQASDVETFLTLVKGKHFILIGDPNQLCPTSTSLYEKLTLPTYILNMQYRMCPNLISFSNLEFYNEKILSFKTESYNNKSPVIFIDTDCNDYNEVVVDNSKSNEGECDVIVKVISKMNEKDIGIITPYSAQAALLKSKLLNDSEILDSKIEIKTIDGFQGREKDYIILSLVRSNNMGDYGFLDDYKRLNVAITRAKKGLVVVGNSGNFRKSKLFSKFFKHIEEKFVVLDPLEIDDYFSN